jgi:Chromosome segregation ATPases
MWLENIDQQIADLYTQYFNTYSRSLKEFESRLEAEDLPEQILVENELKEIKKQLDSIGPNINHMAEDDFKETKERYDFYNSQLNDLLKAKADLVKVLEDIQEKSKELFTKTYKEISDNFQTMFKRLFNGGKAEVILQDPENVLESGIDIFAQPPGKKLISLSLLSGGERSMTAVALLFATYMVKPSPFCILDEIDAALDDRNIGYFLSVLEDFGKSSQFIIITHNKHTVLGSQSLLGVTQMEAGVSTTVSYKLSRIEGQPVILDDTDKEVDFDASGRLK